MRRAASSLRVRIVLGVLAALVLGLGWSGSASAERKRVGVPKFDGPQEGVIRKAVMQVLKGGGYEVVGAKELDAGAKGAGAQLDSNDGFKAVAKELSISAFVTGEVSKKKAKLTVRNGNDGAVSGEGSFGGANPKKVASDVRDGFSRRLGSAVERGRAPTGAKKPTAAPVAEAEEPDDSGGDADEAPAAAKPSKAASSSSKTESAEAAPAATGDAAPEEAVAKKAPSEPDEGGAAGPRALELALGGGGFSRSLSYNQDIYGALRQYKLTLGPAVSVSIVAFPAAFSTSGFVANLGVELNIEQAFGVSSTVPANPAGPFVSGATFGTVIYDRNVGARLRLPLHGGHELAVFGGIGQHAFSFKSSGGADRGMLNIPDTIYNYIRVGLDGRFELPSGMTAGVGAAYRLVLNKGGQISEGPLLDQNNNVVSTGFFPYLTVAGIEANAMLGYHITPSLQARFNVNLRRYFFNMHSTPADYNVNAIAGGAVDQYVGFNVGLSYVFGGATASSEAEEASEAAPEAAPAPEGKKKHKKKKGSEDEDGGGDSSKETGGSSDE
jgi:hypothetical protein